MLAPHIGQVAQVEGGVNPVTQPQSSTRPQTRVLEVITSRHSRQLVSVSFPSALAGAGITAIGRRAAYPTRPNLDSLLFKERRAKQTPAIRALSYIELQGGLPLVHPPLEVDDLW